MARFITCGNAGLEKGYKFVSVNIDLCTHIEGYFSEGIARHIIRFQPSGVIWYFDSEVQRDDTLNVIREMVGP